MTEESSSKQERKCLVAGCTYKFSKGARGWCQSHYRHWRKYGDPLEGTMQKTVLFDDDTKTCIDCKKRLPLSEFHKHKDGVGGRHAGCKSCKAISKASWYAENKRTTQRVRREQYAARTPEENRKRREGDYQRNKERYVESSQRRRAQNAAMGLWGFC